MFPCKYHQNGGFSMAMLVLGRVGFHNFIHSPWNWHSTWKHDGWKTGFPFEMVPFTGDIRSFSRGVGLGIQFYIVLSVFVVAQFKPMQIDAYFKSRQLKRRTKSLHIPFRNPRGKIVIPYKVVWPMKWHIQNINGFKFRAWVISKYCSWIGMRSLEWQISFMNSWWFRIHVWYIYQHVP